MHRAAGFSKLQVESSGVGVKEPLPNSGEGIQKKLGIPALEWVGAAGRGVE